MNTTTTREAPFARAARQELLRLRMIDRRTLPGLPASAHLFLLDEARFEVERDLGDRAKLLRALARLSALAQSAAEDLGLIERR